MQVEKVSAHYRTIRSRQPDTQPSITSLAAFSIRQALMQARVASLASAAARSTSCGNVVHRLLIRNHGVEHVTIVLRMIVESEGKGKLIADYNDFE